ncbi:MAG: QacE family quaternary ammonium compound efflux SMR transporter [Candidatus Reconcilbacillus cellulovorans]|uniref:QacE family quaternary ammonium compound efflux SMR transporter n=1 Tax=Candidatus Reconcilbacillus cellulovorans TaxID=1906605 RepID=A0A2A6E1S9_9BACL|nr:MAG: QacE family quaternary ammonium compound efflux SMR transporter [Candidatus Reconcilbacillus cellulovorans]
MAWTLLILAGLMEVVGVIGLKRTAMKNNWPNHLILIGGFLASFQLLLRAMQEIALSTAYAVWTGIGALGAALVGWLLYKEKLSPLRLICMVGITVCVIGLKWAE